jgi:copper resistance protein C
MNAPSRRLVAVLAAMWLVIAVAVPALAHADLASSDPEDREVLATPPTVITLTFTEGLDQGKSSFQLSGPDGAVGTGKAVEDGSKVMTLDGLDLGAGAYAIKWTAAATDGHVSRGTLSFTVSEPTPAPQTPVPTPTGVPDDAATAVPPDPVVGVAAATASAVATPGTGTDPTAATGSSADVLVPIVVGLVLVGGLGVVVLRRSRGA